MLTDPEVDVAALIVLAGEVSSSLDVVERRAEQVGAAAHDQGHGLGDRLEHDATCLACGDAIFGFEGRYGGKKVGNRLL